MVEYLIGLGPWTWWIVGTVLLCLEIVAPGTIFLWFGVAAIVVGAISLIVDWSWQFQVLTFGVLSVGSILISRRYLRNRDSETDQPYLNRRAEAFVGREYVLVEPIIQGTGKIRIDDSVWRVHGPDLPKGERVRVIGASGTSLDVERAPDAE